jgi:pSer/pThr/pTyr-binding forkhead associated (FHA) protein
VLLGRERAAIDLEDDETSRRHAEIRVEAGRVVIEDLGSTNGTYVDGRRIAAATELRDGQIVGLGRSTFVIEVQLANTAAVTEPRAPAAPPAGTIARESPAPARVAAPLAKVARAGVAAEPFGAFAPPPPPRRRAIASRRLGPTLVSLATILTTAVALLAYFAGR